MNILCNRTKWYALNVLSREFLSGVRVLVGEFDQRVHDEEEQVFLVKSVSVHEKYNPALPMNYDIALIELNQRIQMGKFSVRIGSKSNNVSYWSLCSTQRLKQVP